MLLTIEKTASMWWTVAGDTRRLCDHSVFSAFGLPWQSDLLDAWGFRAAVLKSKRFPCHIFFTPSFRFGKVRIPWFLFCCDRFHRGFVYQPAKVCIFQSRLRTGHCVGFWVSSHPAYRFPRSYEYPRTLGCNRTFCGWGTRRNMRRQVRRCRFRFCHTSFSFLFLHPFRHRIGAAYQAGILNTASGAEMADVEQMKKSIPFVTCEITFGQNVCELMFGINVSNLVFRIDINPVKQPIQSNSVGSWHMSHCWTSAFDYHLNYGFIILKDKQHGIGTRMCSARWNVINIGQIEIGVRGWNLFSIVCDRGIADKFPSGSRTSLVLLVWFGEEWNTSITKSQRSRAGIPSMRKPALREITSASVELCETEVCFFAHPTYWHKCSTSESAQNSSWCWLRIFRVSCKIRVLKQS